MVSFIWLKMPYRCAFHWKRHDTLLKYDETKESETCGKASLFSDKMQDVFIRWDQWAEILSSESGLPSRIIIYDQLQMSAAVHHDDTRQSASPWCFREREWERECAGAAETWCWVTPLTSFPQAGLAGRCVRLRVGGSFSPWSWFHSFLLLWAENNTEKKKNKKKKQLVKSSWSLQTVRGAGSDHNSLLNHDLLRSPPGSSHSPHRNDSEPLIKIYDDDVLETPHC